MDNDPENNLNPDDNGPMEPDRGEEPLSMNPVENEQEEEEEEFPDYANEQNKQLNQIVNSFKYLFFKLPYLEQREAKAQQRNHQQDRREARPSEDSSRTFEECSSRITSHPGPDRRQKQRNRKRRPLKTDRRTSNRSYRERTAQTRKAWNRTTGTTQ